MPETVPTLIAHSKICSALRICLSQIENAPPCHFVENDEMGQTIKVDALTFATPVRAGLILDALEKVKSDVISFQDGVLNMTLGLFLRKSDNAEVRLTEKEVAVLSYLHTQKPAAVSRKDLLAAVWEYAEGVETHTLETHIYRLRQKIENDAANPTILLTDESGYRVN